MPSVQPVTRAHDFLPYGYAQEELRRVSATLKRVKIARDALAKATNPMKQAK